MYNNPMIPADPFMYDLRWIVGKILQHSAELNNLDEKIRKAVIAALDQHDPIYFKNADEMIASGIKPGALAYIEGYYNPSDGGANLYYITDDYNDITDANYYIIIDSKTWAIPIILTPYVTPQMFGAKADGSTDDLNAIEKAINYDIVFFPAGDYFISDSIAISNKQIKLCGAGSLKSTIKYDGTSFAITFSNNTIAWRNNQFNICDMAISSSAGGTISLSNATQAVIKNCKFSSVMRADIDNILLSNESHYSIIDNCWIYGGNGIHIASGVNGVHITNCYLCYCNIAMYLQGGQHTIKHNDVEGYSIKPYLIACSSSDIDAHGERNVSSASNNDPWIEITGSYNIIHARMLSDGSGYYYPLLTNSGNVNKITINGSGYRIMNASTQTGIGNLYDIERASGILNAIIVPSLPTIGKDHFIGNESVPLIFDIDNDDITPYLSSNANYDPSTHQLTFNSTGRAVFDFSSLVDRGYYIYYEFRGISAPAHGNISMLAAGTSGQELAIGNNLCYVISPSITQFTSNIGGTGGAWYIDKLRIAYYPTPNLFK